MCLVAWVFPSGENASAATLTMHSDSVETLAFSPDGKTLASGSADKQILLWDAETAEHRNTLTGHTGGIRVAAFSPDGTTLVSAGQDYTIRVWDPHIGETLNTLTGNTGSVSALAFSPDGKTLATNGAGRTIQLWNTDTYQRQLAICLLYTSPSPRDS